MVESLPSKQVVASSSLVSRSTSVAGVLPAKNEYPEFATEIFPECKELYVVSVYGTTL